MDFLPIGMEDADLTRRFDPQRRLLEGEVGIVGGGREGESLPLPGSPEGRGKNDQPVFARLDAVEAEGAESEETMEVQGRQLKKQDFNDAEKVACSIEAMVNGGECEACQ